MNPHPPRVGIGVIIVRDGKVLVGERLSRVGTNTFQLPGGHLEYGETFEACALREAREETGLTDIAVKSIVALINDVIEGHHYITIGFIAESLSGEPTNPEPDKARNWNWYHPDEVPEPLFQPSSRVLNAWRSGTLYKPA